MMMEKDKSIEQIINEKIESNNEICFLWTVYNLCYENNSDIKKYLDFINNRKNSEGDMEGYLNFLDDCLDKYNYYKNKKSLDKKTAEFYAIKGSIKNAKEENSRKIKRKQKYNY